MHSPGGNPFSRIYWLAREKNETTHPTARTSLAPLQNMTDKVKAHMNKQHSQRYEYGFRSLQLLDETAYVSEPYN